MRLFRWLRKFKTQKQSSFYTSIITKSEKLEKVLKVTPSWSIKHYTELMFQKQIDIRELNFLSIIVK